MTKLGWNPRSSKHNIKDHHNLAFLEPFSLDSSIVVYTSALERSLPLIINALALIMEATDALLKQEERYTLN